MSQFCCMEQYTLKIITSIMILSIKGIIMLILSIYFLVPDPLWIVVDTDSAKMESKMHLSLKTNSLVKSESKTKSHHEAIMLQHDGYIC